MHKGADSLEMDTRKEKGGQGSAENELPLTSHHFWANVAFPALGRPSLGLSLQLGLSRIVSGCIGEPVWVAGGPGMS